VPAVVSSPIPDVLDRVAGLELPDPTAAAPGLAAVLSTLTDPRKPRRVRHGLVTMLSVAVCAVAAGARSFVAIVEWAADLPAEVATALGINTVPPSESAVRRLVQRLDPNRFDTAIGAWIQQLTGYGWSCSSRPLGPSTFRSRCARAPSTLTMRRCAIPHKGHSQDPLKKLRSKHLPRSPLVRVPCSATSAQPGRSGTTPCRSPLTGRRSRNHGRGVVPVRPLDHRGRA
jgi:hypothetical protein